MKLLACEVVFAVEAVGDAHLSNANYKSIGVEVEQGLTSDFPIWSNCGTAEGMPCCSAICLLGGRKFFDESRVHGSR